MFRILLFLTVGLNAPSLLAADFRSVDWGASESEVRAAHENAEPDAKSEGIIAYKGRLGELDVLVMYMFDDSGRLTAGGYSSTEQYVNKNNHIDDYEALNGLLRDKYTQSKPFRINWINDLYKDDYSNWGTAISAGYLQYWWEFESDRTRITHVLGGENFSINHVLRYESKTLAAEQAEKDKEKVLDNL
ncbi:MAG: hypothetical protein AB7I04_00840 [Pseudomonadales bacterium]